MKDGSSAVEVKLFGPVQLYVALPTVAENKFNAAFTHTGVLLLTGVGADGIGLTVTAAVAAELTHPFTVTVTEYVPE